MRSKWNKEKEDMRLSRDKGRQKDRVMSDRENR